jgi:hypothetical protein
MHPSTCRVGTPLRGIASRCGAANQPAPPSRGAGSIFSRLHFDRLRPQQVVQSDQAALRLGLPAAAGPTE